MDKTVLMVAVCVSILCFSAIVISAIMAHLSSVHELNSTIVKLIDDLNEYRDKYEK